MTDTDTRRDRMRDDVRRWHAGQTATVDAFQTPTVPFARLAGSLEPAAAVAASTTTAAPAEQINATG